MWIKRDVVMLPTNEKANGLWWSGHKLYVKSPEDPTRGELNHLYFLSDEEIKEVDWMYNPEREPSILQCVGKGSLRGWKKIIATTDNSLFGPFEEPLPKGVTSPIPRPSQGFIEKFVEEYNKGNIITEVLVEYNDWFANGYDGKIIPTSLKINPKDNTITIKKVKEEFTKMDFMNALHKVELEEGKDYSKLWKKIEQNL